VALALLTFLLTIACGSNDSKPPSPAALATAESKAAGPVEACKDLPPAIAFPNVTAPGPEVPPDRAAFWGAWEGTASGRLAWLVVETVDARAATNTLHFAGTTGGGLAEFRDDGSLHLGGRGQITYTWAKGRDVNELAGVRQEGNDTITYAMRRCTLQP